MNSRDKKGLKELRSYLANYFNEYQLSSLDLKISKNHTDSTFDVSIQLNSGRSQSFIDTENNVEMMSNDVEVPATSRNIIAIHSTNGL